MLQETWLTGEETLLAEGFNLICSGLTPEQQSKRGSQGVAIALIPAAMSAWQLGGKALSRVSAR
eukprot:2757431-Ditylum_brightwellii.AAC.1